MRAPFKAPKVTLQGSLKTENIINNHKKTQEQDTLNNLHKWGEMGCMEYVSLKRCVLRRDLKVERVSELRMSGGRVFQRWGADLLKALDPMVTRRAGGTVN